jgi:5'-nucleotidase
MLIAPAGAATSDSAAAAADVCTITGTEGDDVLVGTPGDDVICGLGGNDLLKGRAGNDVLLGGDGDDRLRGGAGKDVIRGNAGDDVIIGGRNDDSLYGGSGNDLLRGKGGDDMIAGKSGNDTLRGGPGDDALNGGHNYDSCHGGLGSDTFESCEEQGDLVHLQLLGFNDYHGHLEAGTPGNVAGVAAGGAEYLSAKLTELRAGQEHSLTVAAGDLIGGSPAFSGLFHDEPSVETLNAMDLDISSVGNHEFDEGVTELLRMQHGGCHPVDGCYFEYEPYPGADFKWLAANVVNTAGETPLPPYWIEEVDGIKVGFIGMTLSATDTLVAAAGIVGWDFLDEAETANALVPALKGHGAEAIVVLLHEGGSQTPPPGDVDACVGISGPIVAINAALDPEIDALITGHTHLPYNCVLPDAAGKPRIVTSAYSYGRVVTELNLVLNTTNGDVHRNHSTSQNHVVDQGGLTPDPVMTSIIEKWRPLVDAAGSTPIGTITADILRGGTPPGDDRGVESAAGNLVADAQNWATSFNGSEVAFMNPGGVRSDLLYASSADGEGDGVVTFGEAFTFQPFGNTLLTFPMTGAQIISVLEEQCQPAGSSRPFLHLGVSEGFTYDLAKTIDAGGDCTSVTISNVQLNGVALDAASTYIVTANNFLADGGDNFTTFATIDPATRLDGGNDLLALTNYLGTFSPVAPPSTDRVNEVS